MFRDPRCIAIERGHHVLAIENKHALSLEHRVVDPHLARLWDLDLIRQVFANCVDRVSDEDWRNDRRQSQPQENEFKQFVAARPNPQENTTTLATMRLPNAPSSAANRSSDTSGW